MRTIANYSVSMELLRKYEHKARKHFGQNFIIDPSVVKRIASFGAEAATVLEIGPGLGALTQQLAQRYQNVVAYEIDRDIAEILEESLAECTNVDIRLQDFLEADLSEFTDKIAVCANLPYYITTPILFKLVKLPVVSMTLMVQKEIAERLAARPGSREYGSLTLQMQYHYDIKTVMRVSKESFHPRPNVDSIVIQCLPKHEKAQLADEGAFFAFIKKCFQFRRKTLINNLKTLELERDYEAILADLGVRKDVRADALDFEMFVKLFKEIYDA